VWLDIGMLYNINANASPVHNAIDCALSNSLLQEL
jgi:hypothetical protein